MSNPSAILFGVGPGLGAALVHSFHRNGFAVTAVARSRPSGELPARMELADVSDREAVAGVFARAEAEDGPPEVVVFNAGAFVRGSILDLTVQQVEETWKTGCLGGFITGQAAAKSMVAAGRGTILFTGATAALRGGNGFAPFAIAKFGLRALAQSMARELGPKGVHVAHVIIDGIIDGGRSASWLAGKPADSGLAPDAIAETYVQLHRQPKSAWTHEIDLRPAAEAF